MQLTLLSLAIVLTALALCVSYTAAYEDYDYSYYIPYERTACPDIDPTNICSGEEHCGIEICSSDDCHTFCASCRCGIGYVCRRSGELRESLSPKHRAIGNGRTLLEEYSIARKCDINLVEWLTGSRP